MKARVQQRPLNQLPFVLIIMLLLVVILQSGLHYFSERETQTEYRQLQPPGNLQLYRVLSFGSQKLMSYLLTLRLQLHDNQLGKNIRYRRLDYDVLSEWLLALYELNPQSGYPGFLAARVYSQVKDKKKIRKMIQVIDTLFDEKPALHWRRMTEACVLAKHELKDLTLALQLAKKIADLPKSLKLPHWARDMKLVLLDELDQLESAQLLISSMLQNGDVKDPDEIRFLQDRLLKIQQKLLARQQKMPNPSQK